MSEIENSTLMSEDEEYLLFLPYHLIKMGASDEVYDEVLADFDFIDHSIDNQEMELFIESYDLALQSDIGISEDKKRILELIKKSVQSSASILREDSSQLPGQLLARLLTATVTESLKSEETKNLEPLIEQIKAWQDTPWLEPKTVGILELNRSVRNTIGSENLLASAISGDGNYIFLVKRDKEQKRCQFELWDSNKPDITQVLQSKIPIDYECTFLDSDDDAHRTNIIAISSNGKWAIYHGHFENTNTEDYVYIFELLDLDNKESLCIFHMDEYEHENTTKDVTSLAISNDGRKILAGSKGGWIGVWLLNENRSKAVLQYSEQPGSSEISSVALTPDGDWAVAGYSDGKIIFCNLTASGLKTGVLERYQKYLQFLFLKLVGILLSKFTKIPDFSIDDILQYGRVRINTIKLDCEVRHVAVDDEGNLTVVNKEGTVKKITLQPLARSRNLLTRFFPQIQKTANLESVLDTISFDGHWGINVGKNETVKIIDLRGNESGFSLNVEGRFLEAENPKQESIATNFNQTRELWSTETNTLIVRNTQVNTVVQSCSGYWGRNRERSLGGYGKISISSQGDYVLILDSEPEKNWLWECYTLTVCNLLPSIQLYAEATKNPEHLALWDLITNNIYKIFPSIEISESSRILTLGSQEQVKPNKWVKPYSISSFSCTSFSGSKYGLFGLANGELRLCNLQNGQIIYTVKAHRKEIKAVAITHEIPIAVSCSSDGFVKVWNLATREVIAQFLGESLYESCTIALDSSNRVVIKATNKEKQEHEFELVLPPEFGQLAFPLDKLGGVPIKTSLFSFQLPGIVCRPISNLYRKETSVQSIIRLEMEELEGVPGTLISINGNGYWKGYLGTKEVVIFSVFLLIRSRLYRIASLLLHCQSFLHCEIREQGVLVYESNIWGEHQVFQFYWLFFLPTRPWNDDLVGSVTFYDGFKETKHTLSFNITCVPALEMESEELQSERGVDYTKLRDLLKYQNWEEADQETERIILKEIINKNSYDQVTSRDVQNVPAIDLSTIDMLWTKYSYGHYGLTIQKSMVTHSQGFIWSGKEGNNLPGHYPSFTQIVYHFNIESDSDPKRSFEEVNKYYQQLGGRSSYGFIFDKINPRYHYPYATMQRLSLPQELFYDNLSWLQTLAMLSPSPNIKRQALNIILGRRYFSSYEQWFKFLCEGYGQLSLDIRFLAEMGAVHSVVNQIKELAEGFNDLGKKVLKSQNIDNKYEKARVAFEYSVKLRPRNATGYYWLSQTYVFLKDYPSALKACQTAIDLEPLNFEHYSKIAYIHHCQGNNEEAISACCHAINLGDKSGEIYQYLVSLYQSQSSYYKALEFSYSLLNLALPKSIGYLPYRLLSVLYADIGYYGEAISKIKVAIELAKKYNQAQENTINYINLARYYIESGNYEQANSPLEQTMALEPSNAVIYRWQGWINLLQEEIEKAEENLMRATNSPDKTHLDSFLLSLVKAKQGDLEKAKELWHESLELCPKQTLSDRLYHSLYLTLVGDVDGGVAEVRQIINKFNLPFNLLKVTILDKVNFILNLEGLNCKEDIQKLIDILQSKETRDREKILIDGLYKFNKFFQLGKCYYDWGFYHDSEKLYLKALRQLQRLLKDETPEMLYVLCYLCCIYYIEGNYKEAILYLEKVLVLRKQFLLEEDTQEATYLEYLGYSYFQENRRPEAAVTLLKALKLKEELFGRYDLTTMELRKKIDELKFVEDINV